MMTNKRATLRLLPKNKGPRRALAPFAFLLLAVGLLTPSAFSGASVSLDGGNDSRFSDIGDAGSHASDVVTLDGDDVFIGTDCGISLFCPNDPLERWVMAVWLVRVLGEAEYVGQGDYLFDDVDYTQWWAPFVDHLAKLDITKGCATNPARFCPTSTVSRGEMASFLVRAYDLVSEEPAGFVDIEGNTHAKNIEALAASGITEGCNYRSPSVLSPRQRNPWTNGIFPGPCSSEANRAPYYPSIPHSLRPQSRHPDLCNECGRDQSAATDYHQRLGAGVVARRNQDCLYWA